MSHRLRQINHYYQEFGHCFQEALHHFREDGQDIQPVSYRRFANKRFSQLSDERCLHVRECLPSRCGRSFADFPTKYSASLTGKLGDGKQHINKTFQHRLFGPPPTTPHCGPPEKMMCLISWEKTWKRDPHKLLQWLIGINRGSQMGYFRPQKV